MLLPSIHAYFRTVKQNFQGILKIDGATGLGSLEEVRGKLPVLDHDSKEKSGTRRDTEVYVILHISSRQARAHQKKVTSESCKLYDNLQNLPSFFLL